MSFKKKSRTLLILTDQIESPVTKNCWLKTAQTKHDRVFFPGANRKIMRAGSILPYSKNAYMQYL